MRNGGLSSCGAVGFRHAARSRSIQDDEPAAHTALHSCETPNRIIYPPNPWVSEAGDITAPVISDS